MSEPIEKSVDDFLRSHISAEARNKLLLACSGGVDSMVLAHILLSLNYSPALAHCNFQLRGKFSDGDQEFVETWAKTHGLQSFSKSFDTTAYGEKHGISTQMAARDLRYEYFRELMQENNLQYLLTAQHADDSLETILINLSRGSGLASLGGINPAKDKILRPLWLQSKKDVVAYAKKHAIEWREDLTNAKDDYQRNFIRLHVIPNLKTVVPNFESSFQKTLLRTNEDRQLLEELLSEKLRISITRVENQERLSLNAFSSIESKASLLHYWLRDKGKFDIEAIKNSLESESGRLFDSETHELLLSRGELILQPKEPKDAKEWHINKNDEAITTPIHLEFKTIDRINFAISKNPLEAALDFDKLSFPLTLRKWQPGDSFVPLGMKGSKKVSDFFIDEKIDRYEKERIYLLCSGDHVAWIIGKRIDDRFKVTDKTKTIYFARLL